MGRDTLVSQVWTVGMMHDCCVNLSARGLTRARRRTLYNGAVWEGLA